MVPYQALVIRRDATLCLGFTPWGHVRRGGEVGQGEAPVPPVAHHPDRASRGLSLGGPEAVNGFVDEQRRALLRVPVSASRDGKRTDPLCGLTRRSTADWKYQGDTVNCSKEFTVSPYPASPVSRPLYPARHRRLLPGPTHSS